MHVFLFFLVSRERALEYFYAWPLLIKTRFCVVTCAHMGLGGGGVDSRWENSFGIKAKIHLSHLV